MKTNKGKFVLGTRTYTWQVLINGFYGYGKTKREAIAGAKEEEKRANSRLAKAFNDSGVFKPFTCIGGK